MDFPVESVMRKRWPVNARENCLRVFLRQAGRGVRAVSWASRAGWLGLALALAVSGVAASALTAGAARVEITPGPGLTNWVGHKPYEGVLDPLFARALVLAVGTNKIALLCWDLVDAREGAVARVRRATAQATGLPESCILVNGSHTHSAPWSPIFGDPLLAEEQKTLGPVLQDPVYQEWSEQLVQRSVAAVKQADAARVPATLAISRAYAGDVVFNRRPRRPDGKVETVFEPADPHVLPGGLRFGPMDPTVTVLSLRDEQNHSLATVFHLACHPVAIYPYHKGLSADWPGAVAGRLAAAVGGEALFVQGCAGDIVPARRGLQGCQQMAQVIADRAIAALKQAVALSADQLETFRAVLPLPHTEAARRDLGRDACNAEVQVVVCGSLALVALPGEPLIDLALAIQARSPFPHTLVLGYSNGYGVQYVGLPGEKARGGYESGSVAAGADECGQLLVDAAVRLLIEAHAQQPNGRHR